MTTLATKNGLITQSAGVPALVAAIYRTAAGQSIPHDAYTTVNFDIKELDTHNAVTTGANWRFTAPVEGLYSVSACILFNVTAAWADEESGRLVLYKNGATAMYMDRKDSYGSTVGVYMQLGGSTAIYLAAGDYVDIRLFQNSGAALPLYAGANFNRIAIYRVPG